MSTKLYEVRDAGAKGRGLFAIAPIPKGTVIGRYSGAFYPEMGEADITLLLGYTTLYHYDDHIILDPEHPVFGSDLCRGNFSHEPNAAFEDWEEKEGSDRYPHMIAIRNIAAGEEITYDYGLELPPVPYIQRKWKCLCGAPRCWGDMVEWRDESDPDETPEAWEAEFQEIVEAALKLIGFWMRNGAQNELQARLMAALGKDDLEWMTDEKLKAHIKAYW